MIIYSLPYEGCFVELICREFVFMWLLLRPFLTRFSTDCSRNRTKVMSPLHIVTICHDNIKDNMNDNIYDNIKGNVKNPRLVADSAEWY